MGVRVRVSASGTNGRLEASTVSIASIRPTKGAEYGCEDGNCAGAITLKCEHSTTRCTLSWKVHSKGE